MVGVRVVIVSLAAAPSSLRPSPPAGIPVSNIWFSLGEKVFYPEILPASADEQFERDPGSDLPLLFFKNNLFHISFNGN